MKPHHYFAVLALAYLLAIVFILVVVWYGFIGDAIRAWSQ